MNPVIVLFLKRFGLVLLGAAVEFLTGILNGTANVMGLVQ